MKILNSERSDECIDFTMMCVYFFLCLSPRFEAFSNKKKVTEKLEFLRKTSFQPNRFFYMIVIQKLITVNTLNFHQMFKLVLTIYIILKIKITTLMRLNLNFYEIAYLKILPF
ncbi:Uncharacterized protein FWK35_00000839 [Aphis craccivora]|uniref:Uncharacterized protein n=2 Tax=Aphis craccivora TaxID=307492 RepID=A0A6G0ZQE7_APHCR|nr:Uncharacterized protein FWK35_00000839 [Aphis craccivora]